MTTPTRWLALACIGASLAGISAWTASARLPRHLRIPHHRVTRLERNGVTLHGDYYPNSGSRTLAILLHSCTPLGRESPLQQALDALLARNHDVLSLDLRGFGSSKILRAIESPEDVDWTGDLAAWVDRAHVEWGYDLDRIALVGQATGAGVVISYLERYPDRPHRSVLIVPPRGDKLAPEMIEREDFEVRDRWARDTNHPELPVEVARDLARRMALEHLPEIIGDRPVLVVDTPRTMRTDLLGRVAESAPSVRTYIDPDVDHYFGTRNAPNRTMTRYGIRRWVPLVFVEGESLEGAVGAMEEFLAR